MYLVSGVYMCVLVLDLGMDMWISVITFIVSVLLA